MAPVITLYEGFIAKPDNLLGKCNLDTIVFKRFF